MILKYIFTCFFMVVFSMGLMAQPGQRTSMSPGLIALKIDSLETVLDQTATHEQAEILSQLAGLYHYIDKSKSLALAQQVLEIPDSLSSAEIKKETYGLLALYYESVSDLASSYRYLKMYAEISDSAFHERGEAIRAGHLESEVLVGKKSEQAHLQTTIEEQEEIIELESKRFYLLVAFALLGMVVASILVYRFISERKLSQAVQRKTREKEEQTLKLQKFNAELEAAIDERTKDLMVEIKERRIKDLELKKTLKKAEEANYLKNAFMANMSHEIRTPLNGIIGFSGLLETELAVLGNEELYEYAKGIQSSGDRLMNLLTNIIDISRIEANTIELKYEVVAIGELLDKLSSHYKFKSNEKGLIFKTKYPKDLPKVRTDESNLSRVVNILVDNALKYTEKGFITVTAEHIEQDKSINVEIKDTGIGIDEKSQEVIFESFRQESEGYARSYQGIGLGLTLSQKLIHLMGGSITLSSKKGKGTKLTISLPAMSGESVAEVEEIQPTVAIASAPQFGLIDIFIVEDDRMNRMVLEKMLKKTGKIVTAVDGEDTMKIIGNAHKKGHIFEVMLFDINLPAPWDGIKLMQEIKKLYPEYKQIPFIAQTAYAMAGDKDKFMEAGFNDYIAKPVNKNELLTMVKQHFELLKRNEA